MRLSTLQKFILLQSIQSRKEFVPRKDLRAFYAQYEHPPKLEDQQNSVTKSLERLIDKGLLIGYGRRTPEKWFIDTIKLTSVGRRVARSLQGEQQRLPFRIIKRTKNV